MRTRTVAAALRALKRRRDVIVAANVARASGLVVGVVGGAVRDAFLARRAGDLDLAAPPAVARRFAERLAHALSSKVLPLGREAKKILRIPHTGGEVDIWEQPGSREEDLLRRDFTINALHVLLPAFALETVPGALDDLAAGLLRPPRRGVFLEDPVRVLRAARFEVELPGFRLVPEALSELREAAALLPSTPAERRLSEIDRILGAPPASRNPALRRLETWSVLAALLPGTTVEQRRAGLRLAGRLAGPDPAVSRVLLMAPLDPDRAAALLEEWKVPRRERRLAARLRSLPPPGTARGPFRRRLAVFLRGSAPFVSEAIAFTRAKGGRGSRALAAAAERISRRPASLRRILSPTRPATVEEISTWLGRPHGPRLGAALAALDLAIAAGEVRGKRAARRLLAHPALMP